MAEKKDKPKHHIESIEEQLKKQGYFVLQDDHDLEIKEKYKKIKRKILKFKKNRG